MAGSVASERQLTGITNLNGRFQAANSADRVSSVDPKRSTALGEQVVDIQRRQHHAAARSGGLERPDRGGTLTQSAACKGLAEGRGGLHGRCPRRLALSLQRGCDGGRLAVLRSGGHGRCRQHGMLRHGGQRDLQMFDSCLWTGHRQRRQTRDVM